MLSVLKIENIAIIESAEIEFSKGFNVLSGETGAGKSIILDSINAVLGFRTSRELIRTGAPQAHVSALFSYSDSGVEETLNDLGIPTCADKTVLVSRVIGADRNICKINNTLTNVSALREIGCRLVNIHGQQDNRELLNFETHISYLDAFGDLRELSQDYKVHYNKLLTLAAEIRRLSGDKKEKERRIDILGFQIDELEKADIQVGKWEKLRNKRSEMQNFERIQSALNMAYSALRGDDNSFGAVEMLSGANRELSSVSQFSVDLEKISSKLGELYYEIDDLADEIRSSVSVDGYLQAEIEEVDSALDTLYKLSKKYGETEEDMLDFLENAKKELNEITFSDEKLVQLKSDYAVLLEKTMELASALSAKRKATAEIFGKRVCEELAFLDMPNIRFFADFKDTELSENGCDIAEFYISANVGEAPKPLAKIASGGELSRVMLALKTVMAHRDTVSTLVFDEVDTGVSGRAALKVASKLHQVSKGKQVLCVTHSAQLMSFADNHYLIEKSVSDGKTYTHVNPLDFEGRKREIARITGGGSITETQLNNAEEMLAFAQNSK